MTSTPESVGSRFGDNLRRIRLREGLSQERLATLASLHRTEIGLLEKGERVPRIDRLLQLAGAMAIPLKNSSSASTRRLAESSPAASPSPR